MAISDEAKEYANHMLEKKNLLLSYPHLMFLPIAMSGVQRAINERFFSYIKQSIETYVDVYTETCRLFNEFMDEPDIEEFIKKLDDLGFPQSQTDSDSLFHTQELARDVVVKIHESKEYQDIVYQARIDLRICMKRIKMERTKSEKSHINIEGDFTGALQVGGSQNSQTVNIQINTQFDNAFNKVLDLLQKDTHMGEYQKEDAIDALQKLPELAKKEPSESNMKRAKEKLDVVNSAISTSKELAAIAAPYLLELAKYFHLVS
jgi:hypothetical protein